MPTYHIDVSDDYVHTFEAASEQEAYGIARDVSRKHSPVWLFRGPMLSGVKPVAKFVGGVLQ